MAANNEDRRRKPIRLAPELYREGHVFSLTITTYERFAWFERHADLANAVQEIIMTAALERRGAVDHPWSGSLAWPQWREHNWLTIGDVA
jgi:hypothetical protein